MDTLLNASSNQEDLKELAVMEVLDKMEQGRKLKLQGNDHFKNKEIRDALKKYHRSLLYVKGVQQDLFPPGMTPKQAPIVDEEVIVELKDLEISLNNNIAACLLTHDPVPHGRVLDCTEAVLSKDPDNTKAWFRKATALLGMNKAEEARIAATRANRLANGKDAGIRKLLANIEADMKQQQESFNDMFRDKLNKRLC